MYFPKEAQIYFHISSQTLKRCKDSDKISNKQYSSKKILDK